LNLLQKFAAINTFVFDVDGVMTDGSIVIMPNGEYVRTLNIKDGYALQLAIKNGYNVFVITGSSSDAVAERLEYLGITHFYQKVKDKKTLLLELLMHENLSFTTTLYMGDDIPDVAVMQSVAIGCCPADAAIDVLNTAQYISPIHGGKGCVRDVIEKVMRLQGKWYVNIETIASV
jgi:3-deoxy-D-manno-octulosonate 8-phosphate phosphatase (KDO 8-P phosphatase)